MSASSRARQRSPRGVESVTILVGLMHTRSKMHADGSTLPAGGCEVRSDTACLAGVTVRALESEVLAGDVNGEGTANRDAPFARIYDEYFDMVWRAVGRYGVPESRLEDALQEVFMIVHDRLSFFEGRSSLRTWIYGIARRVARNHRSEARLEMVDPQFLDALAQDSNANVDADFEKRERLRLLRTLLAELSPERAEVLVLVELEQLTVAEAADVLEENPNTLQSRLRLARDDLSKAWNRLSAERAWRQQCATKTQL